MTAPKTSSQGLFTENCMLKTQIPTKKSRFKIVADTGIIIFLHFKKKLNLANEAFDFVKYKTFH